MVNKVLFIKAYFKPIGINVEVKVGTGEFKKGMFGFNKEITKKETKWRQTGVSDCEIDGERLSEDIEETSKELNQNGFEIISVVPITSGNYAYQAEGIKSSRRVFSETKKVSGGVSFGYGYSFTEGVIIVARKLPQ